MTATSASSRVIPANRYRRERWRNGLGWTREIYAESSEPADQSADSRPPIARSVDWAWRLSIAEIEHDAAFSVFPGVERELVLLLGNGLRLRFDNGEIRTLAPPHGSTRFAGERAVTGELVDGPIHDFNLMWRPDAVQAQLWHRPLVGPMMIFAGPGTTWAVHLLAGEAGFDDDSGLPGLVSGDTALLHAGTARRRHVLDGVGQALVIRLQQRGA